MTRVNTLNDISEIYASSVINESAHKPDNNNKVGKQAPGDELEKESKVQGGVEKKSDPSKVDGVEKPVDEGNSEKKDQENEYTAGKTYHEDINKSEQPVNTMKKKSIFDKLYEDVLGGDDDMEMDLDMDSELGDEGEDDGEMGEDEVTVTLPRDVAQQLCDMLKAQLGEDDGEEDFEDIEDDLGDSSEDEEGSIFQEGPEQQTVGDAGPSGGDIDKGGLKGKNNKVKGKGSAHKVTSKGHGDGSTTTGDGKPSNLGDKSAHLQGKDNKVSGHVKGGNQELFG